MAKGTVKMEISLEKYEEMQDRIAQLETAMETKSKVVDILIDTVVKRDKEIDRLRAKQPHWISVKDRLPEDDGYYLVRVYYSDIEHCAFEVYGWYKGSFIYWAGGMELPVGINTHGENIPMKVTHWMPLPEPQDMPEKKNND